MMVMTMMMVMMMAMMMVMMTIVMMTMTMQMGLVVMTICMYLPTTWIVYMFSARAGYPRCLRNRSQSPDRTRMDANCNEKITDAAVGDTESHPETGCTDATAGLIQPRWTKSWKAPAFLPICALSANASSLDMPAWMATRYDRWCNFEV